MHYGTISLICWMVFVSGTSSQKMDLIFLLDGSGSVGEANFEITKDLVKDFAENVDLSGPVNLGVVQYSSFDPTYNISHQPTIRTEIKLGQHSKIADFQDAVDQIVVDGGSTYTAHAINKTVLDFKSSERFADDTTSKILILVTDGSSADSTYLPASSEYARENHIKTYAVGIGYNIGESELQIIANGEIGNNERVYHASNYSDLRSTIIKKVTIEIDSESKKDKKESCLNGTISEKMDLVFLLDGSASISRADFEVMKNEIKVFAENTDLSGPVKLGIVQYSHWYPRYSLSKQRYIKTEIKLGQHTDINEFRTAVDKIRHQGLRTYTAHAIQKTVLDFQSSERFSDNTTSKIMILVTDGQASDGDEIPASAAEARTSDIKIYAVGVGDANVGELQVIANGQPDNNERVYLTSDFSTVRNSLWDIRKDICHSEFAEDATDDTFAA